MEDCCVISEVEYNENSVRPVILNFENGTLLPQHAQSVLCNMYKDNHKYSIAAATESMVYSGAVTRDELYNTFIGILDKKTNKMRLVATDYATLSPVLQEEQQLDKITTETRSLATAELNKQFGSKRIKRQTEQYERMKMDIENVKEQLQQTVADVKVSVQDMVAPTIEENDSGYRPRINRNAARVDDVYCVADLVSPDVINSVSEEADRVLEATDEQFNTTAFVRHQIKKLQKSSADSKESKCRLLLYIDCLIKFVVVPAKTTSNKKYVSCTYSTAVHKDIIQKFTVASSSGRLRPNVMKDKCICYILVLCMIACDYKIDLEILSKELKLSIKKLQEVSKVLAFHIAKQMAVLCLPLPAPPSNFKTGRRKK